MLKNRWLTLCRRLGLEGKDQWRVIERAYTAADRAYHDLNHIEECLAQLDGHADQAEDPDTLEVAIWFHDLIYDTRAADNEKRSAEAAKEFLGVLATGDFVVDLIMATTHEAIPEGAEAMLLCDIDLSILGSDSSRYRHYAEAIRREYGWVSHDDYAEGRTNVLRRFLARPRIYATEKFRTRYERQARVNLEREIEQWRRA